MIYYHRLHSSSNYVRADKRHKDIWKNTLFSKIKNHNNLIINNNFKISVIIPLYNGIEYLKECIDSVKNQTIKDWEIIIGVNGHELNSDTMKIAKLLENDKIRVLHFKEKGKINTLNNMVKKAQYNIICLLDVDDKLHNLKFEKQIPLLKNYDVISSNCNYFGDRNDSPHLVFGDLKDFNFLKFNPIINSGSFLKKKDAFFIQKYPMCIDYVHWLDLKLNKKKFYVLPEKLVFIRIHKTSFFNNSNQKYLPEIKRKYQKLFFNK